MVKKQEQMQKFKFKKIEKCENKLIQLQLTTTQIKKLFNAFLLDEMTNDTETEEAEELLQKLQESIED